MTTRPPLPDGYDLPVKVNGWHHDTESNKNGHVWTRPDGERSVAVFCHLETVRVTASDNRVNGFASNPDQIRRNVRDGESKREATVWGVEKVVEWMRRHDPDAWNCPGVNEAVFDPPAGYDLEYYFVEEREQIVYYHEQGARERSSLASLREEPIGELDPEAYTYLNVHEWRGSGTATVALAPWVHAHDEEMDDVVDCPDECGLDVALKLAREWVAETTGETRDTVTAGQSGLSDFA